MNNIVLMPGEFLSTLSLRRATNANLGRHRGNDDFYPRSPCGERRGCVAGSWLPAIFLSTLSLRRATARRESRQQPAGISIHALLAESDRLWTILYSCPGNFYPRSPCGERPPRFYVACFALRISIHALLAESDSQTVTIWASSAKFLSTLSLRRATMMG